MTQKNNLKDFSLEKIEKEKCFNELIEGKFIFPKYTTQLINLANQNAQGTRPNVVGQMSDLINEIEIKTLKEWKKFYLENHKEKLNKAFEKVKPAVENLKEAVKKINDEMIKNWIYDLVINKTAEGLIIQEIILKHISTKLNKSYRKATAEEESKNIDGFIGDKPIQIKTDSYLSKKNSVQENITIPIVYYKLPKNGKYISIYYKDLK